MVIELNNNRYAVKIVKPDDENLLMDDGDYHFGVTDFKDKIIYIADNLNSYSLRYTLIHELTHAVINSYGLMQIQWNDEIVADFIANNTCLIGDLYNEILEKLISGELKYDQTGN